jgi:hypothetical protein
MDYIIYDTAPFIIFCTCFCRKCILLFSRYENFDNVLSLCNPNLCFFHISLAHSLIYADPPIEYPAFTISSCVHSFFRKKSFHLLRSSSVALGIREPKVVCLPSCCIPKYAATISKFL